MTIIKQLKKNEKPFGLMSAEMQAKAKEILKQKGMDFLYFSCNKDWPIATTPTFEGKGEDIIYRLRPDYKDEPEIRLMEIAANNSNCLCMYNDEGQSFGSIATVHERTDFAGFLFKPVFGDEIYTELWLNLDVEHNGNYKMTHASHVRFWRQK